MTAQEKKGIVKAINREVQQIFTKGTHFRFDVTNSDLLADYDTKHVLAFYQTGTRFGYCYFDMSTLRFFLGAFDDDFTLKQFRTLIMQTRPVEFVCTSGAAEHTNIKGQETLKIIRNSPCPPAQTTLSFKDVNEPDRILSRYFDMDQRSTWPEPLSRALSESMESKIALGLCLVFLDKLLLCDTSIPVSQFEWTSSLNEISQTSGESTPGK